MLASPPLKGAKFLFFKPLHRTWLRFLEVVFPIQRSELPRFCTITALLFCLLFVQNMVKVLKDSLITTLVATEVISILKIWCVLPLAILVSLAYVKIIKHLKTEYIFYSVVGFFVFFFLIFGFVLFPNRNTSVTSEILLQIASQWPHLKWFVLILKNWDCALLYVIAEMWSNVVLALLFWQFVNSITSVSESKRFYILFSLLGQTGLFVSGVLLSNITNIAATLTNLLKLTSTRTVLCVQITLSIMSALGILSIVLFWLLNHVVIDKNTITQATLTVKRNQKLLDSIKIVVRSRYVRLMGLLLISYGTAISTIDLMWREKMKLLYSMPELNMAFTGFTLKCSGVVTLICVLLGSQIIRRFGWTVGATIPPICTLISGVIFFMSTNFSVIESGIAAILSIQPALVALIAGTAQNIIINSTKYTLFDATKEMLYIPLDSELKTQGKACTDVIGSKLGKSIGSLLQAGTFILIPSATYGSIGVYLMGIFIVTCLVWYYAVHHLGLEYSKAIENH